jgi:hypothetical protein
VEAGSVPERMHEHHNASRSSCRSASRFRSIRRGRASEQWWRAGSGAWTSAGHGREDVNRRAGDLGREGTSDFK